MPFLSSPGSAGLQLSWSQSTGETSCFLQPWMVEVGSWLVTPADLPVYAYPPRFWGQEQGNAPTSPTHQLGAPRQVCEPGRYRSCVLSAGRRLHACSAWPRHSLALLIAGGVTLSKLGNLSVPQIPHTLNKVMTDLPRIAARIAGVSTRQSTQHSPDTDTHMLLGCWLSPLLGEWRQGGGECSRRVSSR